MTFYQEILKFMLKFDPIGPWDVPQSEKYMLETIHSWVDNDELTYTDDVNRYIDYLVEFI
jgi:hypothetical protein